MTSKNTTSENMKLIQERVDAGELEQYFNTLSREDKKNLSRGLLEDDFGTIGEILVRNLSSYGSSLEPMITSSYDEQLKQLAENLLEGELDSFEEAIDEAVFNEDVDRLETLRGHLEEDIPSEVSERSEEILSKVDKILKKAHIPTKLTGRVKQILVDKDVEIDETTKANVYPKWSNKKPALAVFHKGKILTWQPITDKQYKALKKKKPLKIKYTPTSKNKIKETPKIVTRGGTPLSNKEKLFIKSRSDSSVSDIHQEYLKKFGKVRPKQEILKAIRHLT